MHIPKHFEQKNIEELEAMILAYPFATLVNQSETGVKAVHIPLTLHKLPNNKKRLKGHIGKGNPLWKEVAENSESLAIFHGPNSYISPNYYPSKKVNEEVVPTWNYVAVHLTGKLSFIHDKNWKLKMLNELTNQHETSQPQPWSVSDAPPEFTDKMMGGIVGIEIEVTSIEGQWKVSQNKQAKDSQGVVTGLSDIGDTVMSKLVEKHNKS